MCGIIGVVGAKDASKEIVDGLRMLEYRGYDSAGLAVITTEGLRVQRAVGAVKNLAELPHLSASVGIGHTRWATHGAPTEWNAHPHQDCSGRLAVVHNGIIENHQELREMLEAEGHVFGSQTDTEVLAHLVEKHFAIERDVAAAIRKTMAQVHGSYALVVVTVDDPERLVAARMKSPLLVGVADDHMVLASDATALLEHTRKVVFLDDGDVVELTPDRIRLTGPDGERRIPIVRELSWSVEAAEKGGFEHFLLKEIHDIPTALHEVLRGRVLPADGKFDMEGTLTQEALVSARRILVVACGTSYYAGMVGKSIIERVAGVPVEVHLASEFRYAPVVMQDDTLAIFVSQSGETADTLEAMRHAQKLGCRTLAFVNVVGSTLSREAEGVFLLRAGPEISVASTKAFINMVGGFYILGLHLGQARGHLSRAQAERMATQLRATPRLAERTLERAEEIREVGERFFSQFDNAFFLGRQLNHGLALEGALKIKEISYIHAEGYAAGELKHGPLALLVPGLPVVALMPPNDPTSGVMFSNAGEVRARGAKVLGIACDGDTFVAKHVDEVLRLPDADPLYFTIPAAVALYVLAYHAARTRGCEIDRPRNLAKSVTVE